jgi:hypothetical protein
MNIQLISWKAAFRNTSEEATFIVWQKVKLLQS